MIPIFPNFKKINIHDKNVIEALIDHSKPYSTLNFTNLWTWDTRNTRMASVLNDNLVLLLTDYDTNEPYFVFCGTHKPAHTAKELLVFAKQHGISQSLRFIPEETALALNKNDFHIVKDTDSSDYIFSTAKLSTSQGASLKSKRILSKRFFRENPSAIFEVRSLDDQTLQSHIQAVVSKWEQNKQNNKKDYNLQHEEVALFRLLKIVNIHNIILSSVSINGAMIGFSIDEILPQKYAMAHFIKADTKYKGIYEFLNERTAGYFNTNEIEYWNWQQDLGIPGLKKVKSSYKPIHMLNKFNVSLNK